MLEDNPHYKSVYFLKRFDQYVVSIGVDRMINFWDYNDDCVIHKFNVNCLGGKISKIIPDQSDPRYTYLVGYDNTIRLWDLGTKVKLSANF